MEIKYNRLKDLREDHDYTQQQVAAAIGITQRKYSYIETGMQQLTAEVLVSLDDDGLVNVVLTTGEEADSPIRGAAYEASGPYRHTGPLGPRIHRRDGSGVVDVDPR